MDRILSSHITKLHVAWFAGQRTRHEVILHGLREVTSERQVISHDPSETSMVLAVQNGRKCIAYIYYILTPSLTYVSVDREYY